MEKSDFTIGSLWVRKIQEYDPFYFLVIKTRSLDVQFAGFRFEDDTRGVGTYFFNWKELLTETNNDKIKWEKVSE